MSFWIDFNDIKYFKIAVMVKEVNIDLFYNHSNQKYIFVSEEKVTFWKKFTKNI